MKTATIKVPKLRFPGFSGEWGEKTVGDSFETVTDFVAAGSFASLRENVIYFPQPSFAQLVRTIDLKKNFKNSNQVYVNEKSFKFLYRVDLKTNCIVLPNIGANIGESYFVEPRKLPCDKNVLGPNAILLRTISNDIFYIFCYFNRPRFIQQIFDISGASGQPKFNKTDLKKLVLRIPSINEQKKIAGFLGVVDDRISAMQKKVELMKKYQKGIVQKIFSQQIRFKDENGKDYPAWQLKELGEAIDKNSRRNKDLKFTYVQSISSKRGFVAQEDYFNNHKVASKDLSNYFVIEPGMFAYNPSRINVGSLAYKTDGEVSVVSPLYVSFITKKTELVDQFLLSWFSSNNFVAQRNRSFEGSVRDTLSYESLQNMKIELPQIEEQQKIADVLTAVNEKIDLTEGELEQVKQFKKALLQQMFV